MTKDEQEQKGCTAIFMCAIIALLLALFFFSCTVKKVACGSQVRIPVTTVTIKPDSSKTYNTLFVPYCDSVLIYIQPKQQQR